MEINRTDPGMHCLFFPAFRPEFALNSTFIAFGEVFSIFFMQRWGESDGSQRLIDLLPAFLELSAGNAKKVYVIDEIDRSMHTLLTRTLIDAYLTKCSPETRAQLLFTTHDALLMDQQLLRRDEMWATERDIVGTSNLFSFSEYKDIPYDKNIRKSYLQGRLGGVPRILAGGALNTADD